MAKTLHFLDFDEVTIEKDVDYRTMKGLIAAFGDRLKEAPDAIGFFYFSGHGMQVKGQNYMIPVDAVIKHEADVEVDGVPAWSVLTRMEYADSAMNFVVLDACRNNPFEKRFKSPQEGIGLAPMQAPAGTVIAYATAPGDTAGPGPEGGYSPFTAALANELRTSSASVLQLFNDVSAKVYQDTDRDQRPYLESSVVPPFAFRQAEASGAAPVAPFAEREAPRDTAALTRPEGAGSEPQPAAAQDPAAIEAELGLRPGDIQAVQAALGFDTGDADGKLGPNTRRAITAWQRARGEQPTGYLNPTQYDRLLAEAGPKLAALESARKAEQAIQVQPAVGIFGYQPGDEFRDCPECPEMVVLPAGNFMMGSPPDEPGRDDDEGLQQHKVTISRPFAVGKYEVTFAEWDACVADGGCHELYGGAHDDLPVNDVSWHDLRGYIAWLSRETQKNYRLLSEAEWEYAGRARSSTAYWWGQEVGRGNANCIGCGNQWDNGRTASVGSFDANAFSLHDMAGNVLEWTEDCWHDSYEGAPGDGSAWTTGVDCRARVLRGGSWHSTPRGLRSADRYRFDPAVRYNYLGFRVARTID